MKKAIFTLMLFATLSVFSQNQFRVGANGGIPLGDADDFTTFAIAVELGYLFEINESFEAGPSAGVVHLFGEEFDTGIVTVEAEDITFLPVGGTARFSPVENFWFGADLGYGIGINDGNDGGFYYKPHLLYNLGGVAITLGYTGFAIDGETLNTLNAGVEIGIN